MTKYVSDTKADHKPPTARRKYRRKKKTKKSFLYRVARLFKTLLVIALVVIVGLSISVYKKIDGAFDNLSQVEIGQSRDELMIADETYENQKHENVENIAIFGKDIEDEDGFKRSDTIMILSVNKSSSDVTLTSIQRDTFVKIPGYQPNKINTAYFFGDADLAVQTLNANLDMDIKYYVSVDMNALIDVVNALGGIELTITETEFDEFNLFMNDINVMLGGNESVTLPSPGTYLCDGRHAMVYCRIRKIGNSDFDRTARQRIVLSQIYNKAKSNLSIGMLTDLVDAMSTHIETNIPKSEIMSLALKVLMSKSDIKTYSLCEEEYIRSGYIDGAQCLIPYYLEDMAKDLHKIIYGEDFIYSPSMQLMDYSYIIKEMTSDIYLEEIYTGDTL